MILQFRNKIRLMSLALAATIISFVLPAFAADPMKVTAFNFVRAESDNQMVAYVKDNGGIGKLRHMRDPWSVDPDKQPTIRGNRDTLYSFIVLDLTTPAVITKPKSSDRFQSMLVVNQDHSIPEAEHGSGDFKLTQKKYGTRYVWVCFRTFLDPNDPADVKAAHALQDGIKVQQNDPGKLELPDWDDKSRVEVRQMLNELANVSMTNMKGYFGIKEDLDPLKWLLGAAYGWGGNPEKSAIYLGVTPENNDGKTHYVLNVKDVPVNGFWSISMYNKDGFYQKNKYNANAFNNKTAEPNKDGSFTFHFGGDPKGVNFLPLTEGWNYTVRMYQPKQEIIDGKWNFPDAEPVK